MRYLPLVWAMLWRSRTRTWLTLASIAMAFLLLGVLRTVNDYFEFNAKLAAANTLLIHSRFAMSQPLPLAYRSRIESVKGVHAAIPFDAFDGWFQDPRERRIFLRATDATALFAGDQRFVSTPAELDALARTRAGALVGRDLAQQHGWKLGDHIPIGSTTPRQDGARSWEFEVVGFYHLNEARLGNIPALDLFVNYTYVDEARLLDRGTVSFFWTFIDNPADADRISSEVDALFANSSAETKSESEQAASASMNQQVGNVGLILRLIQGAVLFTLLLVAGNTMAQAFRERVPELAVLKTVGFDDRRVAALIVAESMLLVLVAAGAGLALAALVVPPLIQAAAQISGLGMMNSTLRDGAVIALIVAMITAVPPAWRSQRLTIVEALR